MSLGKPWEALGSLGGALGEPLGSREVEILDEPWGSPEGLGEPLGVLGSLGESWGVLGSLGESWGWGSLDGDLWHQGRDTFNLTSDRRTDIHKDLLSCVFAAKNSITYIQIFILVSLNKIGTWNVYIYFCVTARIGGLIRYYGSLLFREKHTDTAFPVSRIF